ncbi:hypothetical protein NQ318_014318, partial [Aromia moschata]
MLHPYHYTTAVIASRLTSSPTIYSVSTKYANRKPRFTILFTDEATFTRRGVFNWRNNHLWDSENPILRCTTACDVPLTERHHILPCQYANICICIFVIGGLTDLVYQEEVNSLQELRQRIQKAANTFKNNSNILLNIQRHLRRCILKCIE